MYLDYQGCHPGVLWGGEIFELCLKEHFDTTVESNTDPDDIILSANELNVMRYVGGYVARKLLLHYEKMFGDVYNRKNKHSKVYWSAEISKWSKLTANYIPINIFI